MSSKLAEVITTIPKIGFHMESVEYKNLSFTVQKDIEVIHGEVKGGTKVPCYLKEPVRILGKTSTEGFGEETLGTQTIQTAQKQRLRKSRRP